MPSLQISGKRYHLTIPKEYIMLTRWKKGQILVFTGAGQGKLMLEAVKETSKPIEATKNE